MRTWNTFTRLCLSPALLAACVAGAGAQDQQAERQRQVLRADLRLQAELEIQQMQQEAELMRLRLAKEVEMAKVQAALAKDPQAKKDVEARVVELKRLQAIKEVEMVELHLRQQVNNFDRMFFQQDGGSAAAARKRLHSLLAAQIDEIDRNCQLTDAQKEKLRLAGRGDIKRFFDCYEEAKQKSQPLDGNQQNVLVIRQEVGPLRMALRSGLFHEDSLLCKALPNTLSAKQFALYDTLASERRAARHRSAIETAIKALEYGRPLPEAQRRELLAFLTRELKPSRRPGPYDTHRIVIYLGGLPAERVRPLFGDAHWRRVSPVLAQFLADEADLRRFGYLPAEDENDDQTAGMRR